MTTRGRGISGDRLLAIAVVFMVTLALAGIVSADTAASFTGTSANPANHLTTLLVQPPASQGNTTSAAAGVVRLSWTATPTVPGTGHTLSYDVLRGPAGGPYSVVANTASLTYNDTPPADGSYGYVIHAKVTGGGTFTSADSASKTGLSDRTAPTMSLTCNGTSCAGWFNIVVPVVVSGSDAGTGMGSVTRNVDGAGQISTGGSSVSFNVSGQSAGHTVAYFGTDAAGNASGTANATVKIDLTNPTAATAPTSASGPGTGPVSVDLGWTAGTDALSGVAGYTVRWVQANVCPSATPANYPSSVAVGAVTAYSITGLVSGSKYCAYLTTSDNAGNTSVPSAVTGPTKAK